MLRGLIKELLRSRRGRQPDSAECLARGLEQQQAGRLAEAERHYRDALARGPRSPDALHLLGAVLTAQGRLDEAVTVLKELIGREAVPAEAHFTLATALHARGDLAEAAGQYQRATEIKPEFAAAYVNWSNLLRLQGRTQAAVECLRSAIRLDPDSAEAHHNLGKALYESGRAGDALPSYERALELRPESADMRYNHAEALLLAGDLARGWQEYESRFDQGNDAPRRRSFPYPYWEGEDLAGKSVLVWGEQGVGDEILFSGMYEDLIPAAGRCIFECSAKLAPLLARSFPRALVVPRTGPPHSATQNGIDYQIPAGSLGRHLRPALARFPQRPGFLLADERRVGHWRRRVSELGPGLKVGFAWRSSNLHGKREAACTRLDQWGELFRVPGVRWVCLQYDKCEEELEAARRRFPVELHRFGEVDYFDDLDEVAALMAALDLVISAPTVVSVHAAALGREVWQTSYGPDWQTHGTRGNPWFPSMVRFERRSDQEWSEVLSQLARRLGERAGNP